MLHQPTQESFKRRTDRFSRGSSSSALDSDECQSFRSLYEQQQALVRRAVRRFRVANDDVDDVVQEVFMIVHLRFCDLNERSSIEPWLRATARRVSSNWHRWYRRHKPANAWSILENDDLVPMGDELAPDERLVRAQFVRRVEEAIERLHPKKRTVLALSIFEQLTLAEIARRLNTPLYTIASRLRSGYGELASQLARNGSTLGDALR